MEQLETATAFVTLSFPDTYNPIVSRCTHTHVEDTYRNAGLNAFTTTKIFRMIMKQLVRTLEIVLGAKWMFLRFEAQNRGSLHVHLCYKGTEPPGGLSQLGSKAKSFYTEIQSLQKLLKIEKDLDLQNELKLQIS